MAKSPQDYKKTSQQFHSQLEHLHRLLYSTKPCPSTATAIIKSINDAETPYKAVTDQQIIDIFVTGCKALKYTDDACPPFLKFMFKQSSKHIRITKLRSAQLETCVTFILDGLDTDIDAELRVDLLRAFSALLFENAANTAKFYPRIAKTLLRAADRSTTPLEVRRMAINCIGNTCAGAGSKLQPYYSDYYEVLLSNICAVDHTSRGTMMVASTSLDFADPAVRKVASSTLRALQFVLGQDKSLVTNPLCDIIDIIHTFIFMHVSVQSYNSILAAMKDIELTSTASSPHRLARIRGVISPPRSHSWRPNMHKFVSATSSDSELSDSDPVNLNPRRQRDDAKIRINALLCLAAVAKTSSRALYPHWQRFIPDSFTIFLSNNTDPLSAAKQPLHLSPVLRSDNQPFSLFTILLYDPMPTVRTAACNVLLSMFDGAKQYLSVASESDAKTSFTSLSGKLASILRDCHQGLICVIEREQDPRILGLVMKVACTLVANCTYDRLATGYLSRLYHTVLKRWHSASLEIRSSILQVISAILEAFSGHQEVAALVEQPIDENDISVDNLVVFFLVSIAAKEAVTDANGYKIELWHTFATLAKTHFATVCKAWTDISDLFEKELNDKDPAIRAAALKFAESYAYAINESFDITQDVLVTDKYVNWWTVMIEKYIQQSSLDESPLVRTITGDCMANMCKDIFELIDGRHQMLALTLMLPLPMDDDANVKAAGCRALGVFILFPSVRQNPYFVSDIITAVLEQMMDKSLLVRVRASWAQGNLCDAMVLQRTSEEFCFPEWISVGVWRSIMTTATNASMDNDKLRSNAVRAMGSLLQITPKEYFADGRNMQLIKSAMGELIKNMETGALKTRWNACHAASNLLKNEDYPIGYMSDGGMYQWTEGFYHALVHSLNSCKNFKVRINSCLALATPTKREFYGDQRLFNKTVEGVLKAWDACQDGAETEFQEYRYREQLKHQLMITLRHLKDWMSKEDLDRTHKILNESTTIE